MVTDVPMNAATATLVGLSMAAGEAYRPLRMLGFKKGNGMWKNNQTKYGAYLVSAVLAYSLLTNTGDNFFTKFDIIGSDGRLKLKGEQF